MASGRLASRGAGRASHAHRPVPAPQTFDVRWAWGLASAVLIVVGSLGTWFTAGPFSFSGTSDGRDGTITVVLGLVAVVPIVPRRWNVLVDLLALAVLVTGVVETMDVSSAQLPVVVSASVV